MITYVLPPFYGSQCSCVCDYWWSLKSYEMHFADCNTVAMRCSYVAVSCMTRCNWLQCCRNALQKHALLCIIALYCVYHWLHICCSYVPVAGNEHRGLLFLLFLFLTFREIVSSQLFWYFCCFFLGFQNDSYRVYSYAFFILLYMSNYDFLSPQKPLLQLESIEKCCVCHQVTYKSCLPLV